ncbi:MAG: chloride channel protein [Planctomycetes bacterium]|nr:chloride channel protein [Planctomycetota bacterium]
MKQNWLKRKVLGHSLKISPSTLMILLAVLVGVLGGFSVIGFKKMIAGLQVLLWAIPEMTPAALLEVIWYKRLLLPIGGGLVVGPLIYFLAREAKGPGVPEVMVAVITKGSVIRPVVVVVKALASAVTIASGGSVGREGPIVHIGAAIASTVGQALRLPPVQLKTLVGCGVAAGIGATFNAPIAGTLFALELIVTDFGLTAFTPILVSGVMATAITRHFLGNTIEFGNLPHFDMVSMWEFGLYLVLGVLAGLIGCLFSRSIYVSGDLFDKTKIPAWIRPAFGGLLVGLVALLGMPHVMGVGYASIEALFQGELPVRTLAVLVFLKLTMTAVTIGSGGSGGVFAPSLFIGAMLGGAFGMIVNQWFPTITAPFGAYVLVGMAAVNGACTLAPLSAIIILVELTDNYSMVLPLMFTVVMATFVSRKLNPESIYTEDLARRGIDVHGGEDLNVLRAIGVEDVIRHDEAHIADDASFESLVELALSKHRNTIFTVDRTGHYRGVVAMQDLKYALNNMSDLEPLHIIADFEQQIPPVRQDQSLDLVIDRFAETGFDRLPVVNEKGMLVGSVIMGDIIRCYNREVTNRNLAMELGARIQAHDETHMIPIGGDSVIAEIDVPGWMAGRSLGDLKLRTNNRVSVFVVKERREGAEPNIVTPGIGYVFRQGDTVLLGGKKRDIDAVSGGS